ncbi:MAG TPA: PQQ-binding-like beta-propeller repeat protein [Niabella sp.]
MKRILYILLCSFFIKPAAAQSSFQFAHISDLHIGAANADEDLRRTVRDINANPDLKFVIASGDITEFGADAEIKLAKQILDSLNKPLYIIPGNHDDNWSESGTNTFNRVFGNEVFVFNYKGIHFLGANCGPNMKMSPGQIPYGNIVWLDSVLATIPAREPVIFVDHYPLDSSLNNWYEVADRLKKHNIQLYLCGHGHQNHQYNFEGIPAIMGRSNLRAKDSIGGYNIVTFINGNIIYRERTPGVQLKEPWATVPLSDHHFEKEASKYPRPSYAINERYPQVKETWRFQDSSDIGNGFALYKSRIIITPDSRGRILALDPETNKVRWRFVTNGKIYAAPAIQEQYLVIPSTDGTVYCLNAMDGKLLWATPTSKAIVATPVIREHKVFVGSSEGKFRALDLKTGKIIWEYDSVKNFIKAAPLYHNGQLIFGSWGNELYTIDSKTGKAEWVYNNGYSNRMFSPASCTPVFANNKLFIVSPDRFMRALDANTGALLWKHKWDADWVRESLGVSGDHALVFAKTMQGYLIGVDTKADTAAIVWRTDNVFNYELNPSKIIERKGRVYAFSDKGVIAAFDRKTGKTIWVHKVANCLVHDLQFINDHSIVVTTMDGKVVILRVPGS